MLRSFETTDGRLLQAGSGLPLAPLATWYDLSNPAREELAAVEAQLGIELPSREEMEEIELSSRLYSENGAAYMTALILSQPEGEDPILMPVSFILTDHRLVTIRYHDPRAFSSFPQRAEKTALGLADGESILLALLETIVDRLADILERTGRDIDAISRGVFGTAGSEARQGSNYKSTLEAIGRNGDLGSNLRDSLATMERLGVYLGLKLRGASKDHRDRIKALVSDIRSLSDHSEFMAQKVIFLLDATLGLINIEQNAIIKIFSVAAVVFLPPTLVASVYGMNFEVMPELSWPLGYPFAIGLMILSAILPFLYFKRRGWL